MNSEVRIIPCLDVKDGRVVKGVELVNLRDARSPISPRIQNGGCKYE